MTPNDVVKPDAIPRAAPGHGGSASFNLSGRAVLAAWVISIAVHAALFFGMLALVFPFSPADKGPESPVGHAEIIGQVDAASFMPSLPPDLARHVSIPNPQRTRPVPKTFAELSELATTRKPELSIIGIGAGGGDFDKYRLPMDIGVSTEFFGLGSSARGARKIIYVVDRSGSMIDSFIFVQAELRRSVLSLRRSQKFHVIFFNSGPPMENPPKRLVSAIDAQKESFFKFMATVIPRGDTKPERALQRALALKPDLLYLLSDGIDFRPALLRKLDEWNDDRRSKIYTIAYLDQTGSELLERIAREHNGEFKFVSEDDLP